MSSSAPPAADEAPAALAGLVARAAARARVAGRPVLASMAERVPAVDPLAAVEVLSRRAAHDAALAAEARAGRMYWTRPDRHFALAGLGAVATLAPTGAGRFAALDAAWAALLDGALIDDPSAGVGGVGPLLMGGFSFEPGGPRAGHWRGFPSALFVLPRVQVAAVGGECWLTTTVLVGPDGEPDANPDALAALRGCVLGLGDAGAPPAAGAPRGHALPLADVPSAAEWRAAVAAAVRAIRAGEMDKVVLARALRAAAPRPLDVFAALRHLRGAYPECHVFGCWRDDAAFVGASPERLVKLTCRDVQTSSLAGSAPRGATSADDARLAAALLASAKDRVEHAVVRQALTAALAELCDEVVAPAEPSLFTLPQVHHLHTAVRARLRAGHTLLELVARLHPTPAVGGAPREAALAFIRNREQLDRGWYAAPIGWVGRDGGELAVALRSAVIRGDEGWLFAGCGVVADSDPEFEFAETLLKLRPMELALAAALAADQGAEGVAVPVPAGVGGAR